ncbi:uncharacterized protein LOC134664469 [Cydia fagiglandana]|uniref:uncharacterized protein LOC134664469 n=1 Tax=Cydia fagiglandana TaxID=1458189 RepID=UPI002FEE3A0D
MFFVFYFLVFAYFSHSEINCFTQRSIRTTNYVGGREEISNSRGAAQPKGTNHKTSNLNNDLKSNIFDKILSDEMLLSLEHRHDQRDSSKNIPLSSKKEHLITPTLEIIQKWPIFKHINNVRGVDIINQNKLVGIKTKNDDEYLDHLPKSEITSELKLETNKLAEHEELNLNKGLWVKPEINKSSKNIPFSSKVIGMRSLPELGVKEKCKCKKTNPTNPCKCSGTSHNKKRCTHSTPNARAHECSRYGAVTNHSCSQGQPYQDFVTSNPYSFYPVYVPYTYFASEAPMIPYTVSYPQPIFSDLKIPRKHKHKCRKQTTRFEEDLYYEDNDSRERRPYDDNEYYHDSKKESSKGIVYDVNQDALIKEIVKDLKIHNNKDFVKECYCDSSVSTCRSNIFVSILIFSLFKLLSTLSLCFVLE